MSDQTVLQEVDDAVRRDDMNAWWARWGTWVVAAAVVIVVGAAGQVGWKKYDTSQRAQAGAAYSAALTRMAQDTPGARTDFEKQSKDAPEPYRSLARLMVAELAETPEQQATAMASAAPSLASAELADLAAVMAAFRSVDTPKGNELIAKLEPLGAEKRPFRSSVRELQALSAVQKGDVKRAKELWGEIVKDPEAPQGAQQRAQALINLNGGAETK